MGTRYKELTMTTLEIRQTAAKYWKEWRFTVFVIVFLILPAKSILADLNWVPTGSMNPTILEGDFVLVNKAAYDLRFPLTLQRIASWSHPENGDIIICFSPENGTRLIKRVIGVPGDTLAMRNNQLYINGQPASQTQIDPSYLTYLVAQLKGKRNFAMEELGGSTHAIMTNPRVLAHSSFMPVTLPEGQYFVMGDNRDNSHDSRKFKFISRRNIVGKAIGIAGSFDITDKCQPRFGRFFSELK